MEILSGTAPQHTYFRFQADIPSDMSAAMDVATPDQVERLRRLGAEVVNQNRAMLDELCELLRQREAPPDLPDLPNHAAGEVEAPHPPAPVG